MTVADSSTVVVVNMPTEEDVTAMNKLMSDGKRNFVCKQPQLALDCFVELCEKLANFYGQESEKCTEAYLYYGKTLLEIGRIENGVLGHAVKETPIFGPKSEHGTEEELEKEVYTEDEEDPENVNTVPVTKEEIKNQVVLAMRDESEYPEATDDDDNTEDEGEEIEDADTSQTEPDASAEKPVVNGDSSDVKVDEKTDEKVTSSVEEEEKAEVVKSEGMDVDDGIDTADEEEKEGENTDDVSNMELAWEMLELTSIICRRQLEGKLEVSEMKTVKYSLAESKHCLAQISLEAERYEDSVNDFKECLKMYEDILEDKHDRLIAEGHYNIALALSFDKQYSEAIKEFEITVKLLEARVEDLRTKVKKNEDKKEEEASTDVKQWQKEIDQLNDLILLDMKAKLEDAQECKRVLDESMKSVRNAASEMFASAANAFDNGFDTASTKSEDNKKAVHDCSDKIRSVKRQSDDEASNSEKKLKQATESVSDTKTEEKME